MKKKVLDKDLYKLISVTSVQIYFSNNEMHRSQRWVKKVELTSLHTSLSNKYFSQKEYLNLFIAFWAKQIKTIAASCKSVFRYSFWNCNRHTFKHIFQSISTNQASGQAVVVGANSAKKFAWICVVNSFKKMKLKWIKIIMFKKCINEWLQW